MAIMCALFRSVCSLEYTADTSMDGGDYVCSVQIYTLRLFRLYGLIMTPLSESEIELPPVMVLVQPIYNI